MQCHCHNWQDPNSPKTMSPKMYSISAFFLDFFKYLILYHIMLRSHSLKEKYVYIWKFSTVIWRRLTLLNMFLDGITHHSSSFISFLSILSLFKPASPSFLPFQLILLQMRSARNQRYIHHYKGLKSEALDFAGSSSLLGLPDGYILFLLSVIITLLCLSFPLLSVSSFPHAPIAHSSLILLTRF